MTSHGAMQKKNRDYRQEIFCAKKEDKTYIGLTYPFLKANWMKDITDRGK